MTEAGNSAFPEIITAEEAAAKEGDVFFLIFPRFACSVCQPALSLFSVFPLSRWSSILVFCSCP